MSISITNKTSRTGFRLVRTSVNLRDLQRRNSPYFCVISPNSIALEADYVTVVEDRPILSAEYRLQVIFGQNETTQQSHGVFATAKLLVRYISTKLFGGKVHLYNFMRKSARIAEIPTKVTGRTRD